MATKTYKVYQSKTGVLHVSDRQQGDWFYTFGTWNGTKVTGACRSLKLAGYTPAGLVVRVGDTWTYHPEAVH